MSHVDKLFEILSSIPLRELPKCTNTNLIADFMPQKSQLIIRNLLKDIYSTEEPRLLVIIGHLYFDNLLFKMLDRETHTLNQRQQESFYSKLEFLNGLGKFDNETYITLTAINRLRNRFAHDIFHKIDDWDPTLIPYTQKYNLKIPKQKALLIAFNILLLRMTFFSLVINLSDQHRWLYWEKVPS